MLFLGSRNISMFSMHSDVHHADPALVPLFVLEIDIQQYVQVALATLLVYDTIATMDKEVRYFWSNPRSLVSWVYIMNRYVGTFGVLVTIPFYSFRANETICLFSFWAQEIGYWLTVMLIDYILLMGAVALYSDNKKVARCLRALFVLDAAFLLCIIIYISLYEQVIVGGLAKGVTVCGVDRSAPSVLGPLSWIIPLIYGTILMGFAIYKAAEFWRASAGFDHFNLVKVVVQDQALYFLMVIFCSVAQIVASTTEKDNTLLSNCLNVVGSPSLLCILGSRLLIRLKDAAEKGVNGETSYQKQTISIIQFY